MDERNRGRSTRVVLGADCSRNEGSSLVEPAYNIKYSSESRLAFFNEGTTSWQLIIPCCTLQNSNNLLDMTEIFSHLAVAIRLLEHSVLQNCFQLVNNATSQFCSTRLLDELESTRATSQPSRLHELICSSARQMPCLTCPSRQN